MQYAAREWIGGTSDDGILFLDEASVELIEDEPPMGRGRSSGVSLDTAVTRVWIRPYAAL